MKTRIYLDPNDSFYKDAANDWLVKLMDMVGDDQARAMTDAIKLPTWRDVRDAILNLVEQERQSAELANDANWLGYNDPQNVDFLTASAYGQADLAHVRIDYTKRIAQLPPAKMSVSKDSLWGRLSTDPNDYRDHFQHGGDVVFTESDIPILRGVER